MSYSEWPYSRCSLRKTWCGWSTSARFRCSSTSPSLVPKCSLVGHVGGQREQVEQLGAPGARRRLDDEDHELLLPMGAQPKGVDAAFERLRHDIGQIDQPPGIVQVVVVEMNGAPLRRLLAPAMLLAAEIVAGDGACRHVDEAAIEAGPAGVVETIGLHADGKVPGADQAGFLRIAP